MEFKPASFFFQLKDPFVMQISSIRALDSVLTFFEWDTPPWGKLGALQAAFSMVGKCPSPAFVVTTCFGGLCLDQV